MANVPSAMVIASPVSSATSAWSRLRHSLEARLREVLIEGKGRVYAESLHYDEGDAVCQRVILVLIPLKVGPSFSEQRFIDMDELNGRTAQQVIPDLNCFSMVAAAVQIRHDFIEHIRCCNQ